MPPLELASPEDSAVLCTVGGMGPPFVVQQLKRKISPLFCSGHALLSFGVILQVKRESLFLCFKVEEMFVRY